jgi:hypothetical protein
MRTGGVSEVVIPWSEGKFCMSIYPLSSYESKYFVPYLVSYSSVCCCISSLTTVVT